ncbi:MAG: hypothetical protein GOVbin630_163 [Prokaryotic dsDNA virus sp.]|nr:MAG: hypothetical protein GOVbin630_163 [Prokaryotic dsDNA virus sp.]
MKVGDLVKVSTNPLWVGVITSREDTGVGIMFYIRYIDGATGVCWEEEVEYFC